MSRSPPPSGPTPRLRFGWAATIGLIAVGAILGFAIGSSGTGELDPGEPATATTRSIRSLRPPLHYRWTEIELPTGTPVATAELEGTRFALIDSIAAGLPSDVTLWATGNDTAWRDAALDLGPEARVTDVDRYRDTLVLSGSERGTPTVWRSVPGRAIDATSWVATTLEFDGGELGPIVANLTTTVTAVNDAGEMFTRARVYLDARSALLVRLDGLDPTRPPEIEVRPGRLWVRLTDDAGNATLHTVPMPEGLNITESTGRTGNAMERLATWSSWTSEDGVTFELIRRASPLPSPPTPFGYRSSFLNRGFEDGGTRLWRWAGNRGWIDTTWNPPPECGGWDSLSRSGIRLLLVTPLLDTACVSDNGVSWEVVTRPAGRTLIASESSRPAVGGPDGFLIVTPDTADWLLSSRDGITWERIATPPSTIIPRVQFVGDRVIVAGLVEPAAGPTWWIGEPNR